jgi:hypothetical protein
MYAYFRVVVRSGEAQDFLLERVCYPPASLFDAERDVIVQEPIIIIIIHTNSYFYLRFHVFCIVPIGSWYSLLWAEVYRQSHAG